VYLDTWDQWNAFLAVPREGTTIIMRKEWVNKDGISRTVKNDGMNIID